MLLVGFWLRGRGFELYECFAIVQSLSHNRVYHFYESTPMTSVYFLALVAPSFSHASLLHVSSCTAELTRSLATIPRPQQRTVHM